MIVRPIGPLDGTRVEALHNAMGLDYQMPDFDSPLTLIKTLAETDNGKILAAVAVKMQGEVFLWVDRSASEFARSRAIDRVVRSCRRQAFEKGLDQVCCYVPDEVSTPEFCSVLRHVGFTPAREGWKAWSMEI